MIKREIIKPVGLKEFVSEIDQTCQKAYIYRHGLKPFHLIVPLNQGAGRTTAARYETQKYKAHKVLRFDSGREDYIEVSLGDGKHLPDRTFDPKTERAFDVIEDAAVYGNYYREIVVIHLDEMAATGYIEKSCLDLLKEVCDYATVIFFLPENPNEKAKAVIKRLQKTIRRIKLVEVSPYTEEELCEIILRLLFRGCPDVRQAAGNIMPALVSMLKELQIHTIPEAYEAAERFLDYLETSCLDMGGVYEE